MTCIAYDGKILAADSLTTYGTERKLTPTEKIKFQHGLLYAVSGLGLLMPALIQWHRNGANPKEVPQASDPKENPWSFWVIDPIYPKKVTIYQSACPYPHEVSAPLTTGAGADYATGAMYAGKNAYEAVEIAIKLDTTCGPPVQTLHIETCLKVPEICEAAE